MWSEFPLWMRFGFGLVLMAMTRQHLPDTCLHLSVAVPKMSFFIIFGCYLGFKPL